MAVVAGCEFEVNCGWIVVLVFVFEPQVRDLNSAIDDGQAMVICHFKLASDLFFFRQRGQLGELPIDGFLKLEVENYSGNSAA